jgi:hypothetical protein
LSLQLKKKMFLTHKETYNIFIGQSNRPIEVRFVK